MIYFDFDGTLVDVWKRYYAAFRAAVPNCEVPFDSYCSVKRRERSDSCVAAYFGASLPPDYTDRKRQLLESIELLKLDVLLVPKEELLDFFYQYECRVLTCRRSKERFYEQLAWLGLSDLTEKSIVLYPAGKETKKHFLENNQAGDITIIGDSLAEWEVSEIPQAKVFLVKTGLQDPEGFPFKAHCKIMDSASAYLKRFKEMARDVN